jgi:hypothetical protein
MSDTRHATQVFSSKEELSYTYLISSGLGKAAGDAKLESEGKADKIERKVQNAIGGLKDTLKGK